MKFKDQYRQEFGCCKRNSCEIPLGSIGASLQTIMGGNITILSELCEKTREEAFDIMTKHAESLGANAIIGIRYESTEILQGVTEVLCYGTAVIVEE